MPAPLQLKALLFISASNLLLQAGLAGGLQNHSTTTTPSPVVAVSSMTNTSSSMTNSAPTESPTPTSSPVPFGNSSSSKSSRKSSKGKRRKQQLKGPADFSHYVLATMWPAGFCEVTPTCDREKPKPRWTIHGLWPSNNRTENSPVSCPISAAFSAEKLGSLRSQLERYWPTYIRKRSDAQFWKHEWLKHGSCSVNHTRIGEMFDYFNTTLNLFRKHNISEYLANNQVHPRLEPYKTTDFFDAITDDIGGTNINVFCQRHGNRSVVVEVRLCLDEATLEPVDCPWKGSSCRKNLYYLPASSAVESVVEADTAAGTELLKPASWRPLDELA